MNRNTNQELPHKKILFLSCFIFLVSGIGFSQDSEDDNEIAPQKRNIVLDTGYTLLNINTSNIFLNLGARLGNAGFAQANFETIWENLFTPKWMWEDGDRFLINKNPRRRADGVFLLERKFIILDGYIPHCPKMF
jgi:hypothetical protein